jgi:hypothetical protein
MVCLLLAGRRKKMREREIMGVLFSQGQTHLAYAAQDFHGC